MKFYFLLLFVFFSTFLFSQENRVAVFENTFKKFQKENKKDSLFVTVNSFEANTNLTQDEKQIVLYYKALYYKSITNHKVALVLLKNSLKLKSSSVSSQKIVKATLYQLSDSYFTTQDFDKANFYGNLALKDFILNYETHSKYIDLHSIIGFYNYLQKKYKVSFKEYQLALEVSKKYNPCKISEVNYKIAQIYSKLNQFKKAENTIFEGLKIADSCKEKINKVNTLRCYRNILLENNKIEKANLIYKQIEALTSEVESKENITRFDSLESAFKSRLKDQENKLLKALNFQKEQVVKRQKGALITTIIGLIILAGLLFFVFILSNKQKKSNFELEIQKLKIEENNKDLNRLNLLNQKIFSVISHDFKGPITTLKMMLSNDELAKIESPVMHYYLKDIYSQLDQSEEILNSLLNWAKTELMFTIEENPISNLNNITNITIFQLKEKSNQKNILIVNKISETITILFSEQILNIVLRNILINAIKFSFENSQIQISYKNNAILVTDFGKGIEAKKLEKLFHQSINPGLGTNYESGFGMGLYLCNEIMLKNGGSLSVQNNPELGCTFRIHFPI